MKSRALIALLAALLVTAPQAAKLDSTDGTVLAFDRKANTLVLTDKTVWSLELMQSEVPSELQAGDRVEINYESDEDGISAISDIKILPPKP